MENINMPSSECNAGFKDGYDFCLKNPKNKTFEKISQLVRKWSEDRGLHQSDPSKQLLKACEELGETVASYLRDDTNGVIDGLGDILVVLTIFCQQNFLDLTGCFALAYEEIKDRRGKIINGNFVKEADIHE